MKKTELINLINDDLKNYDDGQAIKHNNNLANNVQALKLQLQLVKNCFNPRLDYNVLKTGSRSKDSKTLNNGAIVELALNNALGNKVTELAPKGQKDLLINGYSIEVKSALNARALPRVTTIIKDKDIYKYGTDNKYIIFVTYKGVYYFTRVQLLNAYESGCDCFQELKDGTIKLKAINLPHTFKRSHELEKRLGLEF